MKIDHAEFKNINILDYKAKFLTDYEAGFSNGLKLSNTLQEARHNKAYGPIYICFKIEE